MLATVAFLAAGTIKGLIGIGLPTITISIMSQTVDPRIPIALLLIPALVTNTWQVYRGRRWRRSLATLWPFCAVMMVTMYISSQFAPLASTDMLVLGIGCVVVLWTLTSFIKTPPRVPAHFDGFVQTVAGGLSGFLGGLTAIWSPPMLMYLLSRRVDKEDFVRFTGFIIIAGTVPLTIGYINNGLLTRELAMAGCLMLIPTLGGFSIGERLRSRLNGPQFQKIVLVIFFLMGLNLIRRAVF